MRRLLALSLLPFLAACTEPPATAPAPAPAAVLPGRYVQTDGHHDITLLVAGGAQCGPLTPAEAATALAATNAVRAGRGLAALTPQRQLQAAAEAHACEMAQRGTMTHRGTASSGPGARLRARGYSARVAAENIAAGRFSLAQVLGQWSGSAGHVANITRRDVQHFALGRAYGADGKTSFWAAVYAGR